MFETLLWILGVIVILYICYYQGTAHVKAHQGAYDLKVMKERIDTLERQVTTLKRELEELKRKG